MENIVNNEDFITVCITGDSIYTDQLEVDDERTKLDITGQTSGRDDWIVLDALETLKTIHVFYRKRSGIVFNYLGTADHKLSFVTQERRDGWLLHVRLFVNRGEHEWIPLQESLNDVYFKYKAAVFEHLGIDTARLTPMSLQGCFHALRA